MDGLTKKAEAIVLLSSLFGVGCGLLQTNFKNAIGAIGGTQVRDLPQTRAEFDEPTPVGKTCFRCGEPIVNRDDGIIMPYVNERGGWFCVVGSLSWRKYGVQSDLYSYPQSD